MGLAVQWYEGMLLSPQHFQQTNNYQQEMLSKFSSISSPFNYGIFEIDIDTATLTSGVVRVMKISGVFQDGLYFNFDALHDHPLERNLSEHFLTNSSDIKIFLAIQRNRSGENMLTGPNARYYSSEISEIVDENTGDNPINMPILKPRLQLLTATEMDSRYVGFPIAEIAKSIDGGLGLTKFIPPFIAVDSHSNLVKLAQNLVQMVRDKISYFSDRKDNYLHNASAESMAYLRLLIQAVLQLEAIIRINTVTPFEIYRALLQLVSAIAAIRPTQLIPQLPAYEHENLFKVFNDLTNFSYSILESLKQKYTIVPFEKDGHVFKIQLKREWLEHEEISIGIRKSLSSEDDSMLRWINSAQIASESMLPLIRDKRVIGAERRILERGAYITQPSGMTIIAVKTHNTYIRAAEKLCITNNAQAFIPEEVVLYAE